MADQRLNAYRKHLLEAEKNSQEEFDKTVVYLSTGALGVSFAFVNEYLGDQAPNAGYFLLGSWIAWSLSAFTVLLSYYFSQKTFSRAIKQVDEETIDEEHPGGWLDKITGALNLAGALLFLAGLILMVFFVGCNLE